MKKVLLFALVTTLFAACNNTTKNADSAEKTTNNNIQIAEMKDKTFDELFTKIEATEIDDNVFRLIGQDHSVITAGGDSAYNSMTASYGGWGQLLEVPTTWCILNGSRYTLEFIRKEQKYTMSYFTDRYKDEVLAFGSKSGRSSNKMEDTKLTTIKTPSGNISYKEARMIIECQLIGISSTTPDDFLTEEGKAFIENGRKQGNGKDYHKLVFGKITNVWVSKVDKEDK